MPEGFVPVVVVARGLWVHVGLPLDAAVHRPHQPFEEGEGRGAQPPGQGDACLARFARRRHRRAHFTQLRPRVACRRRRRPRLPRQRRRAVRSSRRRGFPSACALEDEVQHLGHEAQVGRLAPQQQEQRDLLELLLRVQLHPRRHSPPACHQPRVS